MSDIVNELWGLTGQSNKDFAQGLWDILRGEKNAPSEKRREERKKRMHAKQNRSELKTLETENPFGCLSSLPELKHETKTKQIWFFPDSDSE